MPISRRAPRGLARAVVASAALLFAASCVVAPGASAAVVPSPITYPAAGSALSLTALGSYETGQFDESAAEIVAYHAATQRLFVVNAQAAVVDVLDIADPAAPKKLFSIGDAGGGVANSVAIRADGLGAIALEAPTKTDAGSLLFFDATADAPVALGRVTVGALPDMVTIAKDGSRAVVANEGEPSDDFTVDPEGSVSVVDLPTGLAAPAQSAVRTATFHPFEAGGTKTLPADVRVFGPTPHGADHPVSRNLEPEYIAIDGGKAYAALQEANAVAVVDLATATVEDVWPLGFKDHGLAGQGLDASDRDPEDAPAFNIRTFEGLNGMYMPDGINAYTAGGATYLVTANEGDAREWGDYVEGARVKDLGKDGLAPICADSPLADLTADGDLGRLTVTTATGLGAAGDCYGELYSFGSRSFSIWTTDGRQVFDSGDDFERISHAANPEFFNSNHSESNLEGRSDDKGPEPENLAIGEVGGRTYAFVGFERVGGVAVYDISTPKDSTFVTYVNNRDFAVSVEDDGVDTLGAAGDLGPEGLAFIPAGDSPTGKPMLAVGNEVSGTTTLFGIDGLGVGEPKDTTTIQVLGINDFHGRIEANGAEAGTAVLGGAVTALKDKNPNTLFVSAGDNIGASTFTSFSQQDNPTIDALAQAGLDVSAVGNHEFDAGFADLTDRVIPRYAAAAGDPAAGAEAADFALGANVYLKGTETPALKEYAIREVDGVQVAFIGTVTEQTAALVSPDGIESIDFGNQTAAANRVARNLSDGDAANGEADVIVLLAHDGSAGSDCAAIAAEDTTYGDLVRDSSPNIDAILSGHTHQSYACSFPVKGGAGLERPVLQAHQYGTTLDQLTIEVDPTTKDIVSLAGGLLSLTTTVGEGDDAQIVGAFEPLATVAETVAKAAAQAEVAGAVEVGSITADILRGGTNGSDRGVESSLGNLAADIQLWATSNESFAGEAAQIAIMNPGGLRADLLYGTNGVLTYKDVAAVQPFGNTLVTLDLTGAQLKAVLEEQWQPDGSSRPKLHLGISDGLSYVYDPAAARGSHVVSMEFAGKAVADGDVFRVVTNSFLAAGGDNFTTFAQGGRVTDTGQSDLVATVQYFEAHPVVEPAPLGRAVLAADIPDGGNGSGDGGTVVPGDGAVVPGAGNGGSDGGNAGNGTSDTKLPDNLATTGATLTLAGVGIILALLGGVLVVIRRRRTAVVAEDS
ncbi:choice-of-anchor I family protein [Arthrobacter sp. ZBG10]|uniref:choice-of-anchor I family protein n=1 Tax=Arthrobacter sp. ZBG10 TaxID=1676590 RepID=UPI0009E4668D|nr:choice-of-anchor I family protein [Arthrobacter sp. ZBG10]